MADDDVIEFDPEADPTLLPPWYQQFLKIDEKKRKLIAERALSRIKVEKPKTFTFIKKLRCELVGVCPRVEYAVLNKHEGDLDATYIHAFSGPTLVYWCEEGSFAFVVNVNLAYNDTVLNKVKGNRRDGSIKGFTG